MMDVRGGLVDPTIVRSLGRVQPNISVIRTRCRDAIDRQRNMTAVREELYRTLIGEFDPGSGRTLAACLTHASHGGSQDQPANGCVTREQPAALRGIAGPTAG